ncbi:hypothetical protein ACFQ5M_04170 [Agrilactobacillus yilanensis]|uniref:Uncharacterized protein n=1 Tax=Agrilactobacillus yilanensis TaxID=2485997 RepID=A0ABW4J776_9LACO|nr:hypothetical protein [Agrilactobacillus yilanensis]
MKNLYFILGLSSKRLNLGGSNALLDKYILTANCDKIMPKIGQKIIFSHFLEVNYE